MSSLNACPACAVAPVAHAQALSAVPTHQFSVPDVRCAACIQKIEAALGKMPGVVEARVNLTLKRVSVFGETSSEADVLERLRALGFDAHVLDQSQLSAEQDPNGRALLLRLAVAGFAMMNVMLLSVAVWSGATSATRDMFHLISAGIALPTLAYAAQPFFANAWRAVRHGQLNMDVPISLAIILAAAMSLRETLMGGSEAYFDAALSLTFFLLIGRYLDHRTRAAARSAAHEISALETHRARRVVAQQVEEVPLADLAVGDEILVPTGTRIPVDGRLLTASAVLDRAFLTGESAPVNASRGDDLQAGEINLGQPLHLTATAVGDQTSLRRLAALIELAENSRNTYTALADRAARIYAPAVHLLALVAGLAWYGITRDADLAVNIAIAVLIITCPCALGLAVPAVATAAVGRLFERGALVKHGTALERLAEVDTIIFDKTGTLTLPGHQADVSGLTPTQQSVALGLAQTSAHPVSGAIAQALSGVEPAVIDDVTERGGSGLYGNWNGVPVFLGKGPDGTVLIIGSARPVLIPFEEQLRPGVVEALDALRKQGYALELLTGDVWDRGQSVAAKLRLDVWQAGVAAEQKHKYLTELATNGHKVLMVGDGLNDTASLACAHASIAPASGLDAPRAAADVVILKQSFADLPDIMATARGSTRLSKQNFGIAAVYNMIAVPIAVLGFATPLLAALAMSTSSITVLLNALRIRWRA